MIKLPVNVQVVTDFAQVSFFQLLTMLVSLASENLARFQLLELTAGVA